MMYPRRLKKKLLTALEVSPVVLLTGGRQTGKTTLMKEVASEEGFEIITLDDIRLLYGIKSDPMGFIDTHPTPLIIDEIQRAPELALPIKLKVDNERRPGMFALTGSSNPLVAPKMNDSLAGRIFILHLWPLSQSELIDSEANLLDHLFNQRWTPSRYPVWERKEMIRTLMRGGYPSVQNFDFETRDDWFNNHLRNLLERDVQDLTQIRKLDELPALLRLIGNRSATVMNISEYARTMQMASSTLTNYFSLLEALFLVSRQPAWHKNTTKRMTKSPKLHVTDTGIMTYLIGADEKRFETQPELLGHMLETYIFNELQKLSTWSKERLQNYHFRSAAGIEVDCVLENRPGMLVGIEVKSSETVRSSDFKGLRHMQNEFGDRFLRGIVLYPGNEVVAFGEGLMAIPMSSLWHE